MKRLFLLSTFVCLSLSLLAQGPLERRVDFEVKNSSIADALEQLSELASVRIAFSSDIFPAEKRISFRMRDAMVKNVLSKILKNTGVQYRLVGRQIVLYFKPPPPKEYTISGYIRDAISGEKLIAANVYESQSRRGTSSNAYGFYSLTLQKGIRQIRFSYLGYQMQLEEININSDLKLNIDLKPAITLSEVVVTARPGGEEAATINTYDIVPERYETLPTLGGEVDVIRLAHLLPGVQTGADGVGGIHIRGGNADQNLVLLDGVPVYNPAHMAGIFSVFNSKAIRSARLTKGSFPARYGGRLSSVLDVRTKEGNKKSFRKEINLGLTSAKFTIEGPLKKDTSSIFLSARRSFLDFFVRPISERIKEDRGESGFSSYNFYDVNAKINFSAGDRNEFFASFYKGGDNFHNETRIDFQSPSGNFSFRQLDSQDLEWGNTVASLRWNHIFGNKLFSNASINYSRYQFESSDVFSYEDLLRLDSSSLREFNLGRFSSLIQDVSAKLDIEYVPSVKHYWRMGAELTRHYFRPGVAALNDNIALSFPDIAFIFSSLDSIDNPSIATLEAALYAEDEWQISDRLHANIGLRASMWQIGSRIYYNVRPRLAFSYDLKRDLRLKASYSSISQYLHLLTTTGIGLPNDLWVPSTERVAPQDSWQVVVGVDYRRKNDFDLSVEGYFKKLNNVIAYQEGSSISFINADNWENNVTTGQGWTYGMELFLDKSIGNTTGWLSYTLSWSLRQFNRVNLGETFPFRYDRRHNLKLVLIHKLGEKWELSGNWVYGTGLATTLPISEYQASIPDFPGRPELAVNFGDKNSFRLPNYHRLDVGANYSFGRNVQNHTLSFGFYNVYNRRNPLYYRLSRGTSNPVDPRGRQYIEVSLLPVTPYFSYSIEF